MHFVNVCRAPVLSSLLFVLVLNVHSATPRDLTAAGRTERNQDKLSCDNVHSLFAKRNLTLDNGAGDKGPICGGRCCSATSEVELRKAVRRDQETLLHHEARSLHDLLSTTAATFQNHVIELAKQSENKTHHLFSQVYQRMAVLSREPINALYMDIRNYVNNTSETSSASDLNIEASVKTFFTNLFPLVYHHVVNLQHKDFSNDYKSCLRRKTDDIQPFGEIPRHMARSIYRSLEATRVLLQALTLGSEVLNSTDALWDEEDADNDNTIQSACHTAMLKMTYCPKCQGLSVQTKPCYGYCLNVLRGCLSQYISEMDSPWTSYVEAVESLVIEVKTQITPYNVENVIRGLETKISEAIMYAMENGPNLEKKVQWACGNAKLSEAVEPPKIVANENLDPFGSGRPSWLPQSPASTGVSPPETQILHFLASVAKSKGYFSNLADMLCNNDKFAVQQDGKECWNGEKIGEYTKTVVLLTSANLQKYNPEVSVENHKPYTADNRIVRLSERLKQMRQLMMSQLSPTYPRPENYIQSDENTKDWTGSGSGGYHYDWTDDDENYQPSEGSGSGHGGIQRTDLVHVYSPTDNISDNSVGTATGAISKISYAVLWLSCLHIMVQVSVRQFGVLL